MRCDIKVDVPYLWGSAAIFAHLTKTRLTKQEKPQQTSGCFFSDRLFFMQDRCKESRESSDSKNSKLCQIAADAVNTLRCDVAGLCAQLTAS